MQEREPERWAQYIRRRGAEVAMAAPEPSPPVASSGSGERDQDGSHDLAYKLCQVDVSEVFSPPRVCAEATKFGLVTGDAMDLTTGWDFTRQDHRAEAERRIDQQKPMVLIGSPPCTAFSQLQSLSPASDKKECTLQEGLEHMRFVVTLYEKQVRAGRVFVHENPARAKSWVLPEIRKMMRTNGVNVYDADQCMYGLKT